MSNSLAFYADAGLTTPLTRLDAAQATDGNAPAVDRTVYLGSTATDMKFWASSDPNVDPIIVSIVDSLTGSQIPASTVRLALTAPGLGSATPGASLDVGDVIFSEPANSLAIYVRFDAAAIAAGTYDNLSLTVTETVEVAAL
jgi:hypothetical protein